MAGDHSTQWFSVHSKRRKLSVLSRCGSVETCRNAVHPPVDDARQPGQEPRCQRNIVMSKVLLKNLKKVYDGNVLAVYDVNLEIEDKEFIVLVGPSGCGKSTTLRMVAGLEDISEGELYIDGRLCNDVAPKDRDIAMVFQNYALYPHLSVYDNMAFALKLKKTPKDVIDKKVREVARILGITQYLDRKPKALSGGQRQRVAIGRAMVRDPKVFLMDEPLSNLDAKLRNQMRAEIIKLRQRINTTFMYVTHDQTEAMTLGDRIVIMKDGYVNQIGTPVEVFSKPVNLFVAGFIGMPVMNFFDNCKLLLENGTYFAEIRGVRFELDDFQQKALRQNGQKPCEIVAGIRPQHITVGQGELSALIEVSEMLGTEVNLHTRSNEDEVVMVIPTVDLTVDVSMGKHIKFTTQPKLIQLFDKATGNNLIWFDEASSKANAPKCKEYSF
ncbi:MAG: sn-glycerol-3-phosphate ABC transporter ATP-binding protein UgpC [Clostridia bacterium]|nr:sn-glycerol-3-phosphate ABC transporter ATP-binding protein UgpC [Clostridia bacterium]